MYVHVYVYERPIGGEKSERGREREDRNEWRYNKQKFVLGVEYKLLPFFLHLFRKISLDTRSHSE